MFSSLQAIKLDIHKLRGPLAGLLCNKFLAMVQNYMGYGNFDTILTISHGFVSYIPPQVHRVTYSTSSDDA